MATATLAETRIQVRAGLEARDRDPLAWFRFAVPRLREGFRLYTGDKPITELHARGPNLSGKSLTFAAWMLGCLQQRDSLDGVPIPRWKGRVEGVQLVRDYKVQLLSVQPAYLRLLGTWPHHARYQGEILESLRVKPVGGSDDEGTWSVVYFISQKNQQSGIGVRADVVLFDEPPVMKFLRELRKAAHAGRRGIIGIGETPEYRSEWAPLRDDYGETPRRSIRRVDEDRAEVRWSLDEVEEWVLSREEKRRLWRKYQKDPLFGEDGGARWHGDYTNVSGSCAFGKQGLQTLGNMIGECREPALQAFRAVREDDNGEPTEVQKVNVQVWRKPEAGRRYYLALDPASGVDDGKHNPAGFLVVELGTCNLAARWNGYMAPFTLGTLAAAVGKAYNTALVDVEMKDHWGVNVVRGLAYAHYGNIGHEKRELRPGDPPSKEAGYDMNEEVRSIIIGCTQEWIEARGAGIKYADCPSKEVVECLMDMELDERGKIVAGPGIAHAEDAVLWGRCLQRAASRSSREIPEVWQPPKTPEQELMARLLGKKEEFGPPAGGGVLRVRR